MTNFGDLIKGARQAAGMTLDQAAVKMDTQKGYISGIERGVVNPPSEKYIPKIAKMYGLEIDALLALAHAQKAPDKVKEFFLAAVHGAYTFPKFEAVKA